MVATAMISGLLPATIPGTINTNLPWSFAGPTVQVTTTATQRITGTIAASLGILQFDLWVPTDIDLCYRSGSNPLVNFHGDNFARPYVEVLPNPYQVAGSVQPGAGTWEVGFCVRHRYSTTALAANDAVNGWVMVTN